MSSSKRKRRGKPAKPFEGGVKNPSSLYRKNIEYLKRAHPHLATKIDEYKPEGTFFMVGDGSQGQVNLSLPDGQGLLYRKENLEEGVKEELERLDLKNAKAALFLGVGLGYEVHAFVQNIAHKYGTTHLILVEKYFEIFYHSLKTCDYSSFSQKFTLHFVIGEKQEDLFVKLQGVFSSDQKLIVLLKAMKPVFLMQSLQLSKEYYLHALKTFREAGIYRLNGFGNSIEDSLIGVRNMLENINEIIYNPGINLLFDQFKGKPAIVASTGPSLNKTKHLLKGLEDKALIIAPEASLRPLLEVNVKPHMIVSIERVPEVIPLMQGFSIEEVHDVYYAATPVILNEAYRAYPGPRIIVYRNFDHFKWLQIDRGILNISHSTGNMSFEIAVGLGCNPILLIGQDLAYGREGVTHASGVFEDDKQKFVVENRLKVMGNDGNPVYTNQLWNLFRTSYEVAIAKYDGRCINCSEGGAYIKGSQFMTFPEALDKHLNEPYHPKSIIQQRLNSFTLEQAHLDRDRVASLVDKAIHDMHEVFEDCQNGVNTLNQHREEILKWTKIYEPDKKTQDRFSYISSYINGLKSLVHKNKDTFQLFFMHIIQSFYLNFEIEINSIPSRFENQWKASIEQLLSQDKWFAVIGDTAKICIDMLEKAKSDLNNSELSEEVLEKASFQL